MLFLTGTEYVICLLLSNRICKVCKGACPLSTNALERLDQFQSGMQGDFDEDDKGLIGDRWKGKPLEPHTKPLADE